MEKKKKIIQVIHQAKHDEAPWGPFERVDPTVFADVGEG